MKSLLVFGLLATAALCDGLNLQTSDVDLNIELPTFPSANLNSLSASSTNTAETNQFQFGIIQNAKRDILTPVRSIDSLFSRLPSSHELNIIILSADVTAIYQTVQTLISNDAIPCNQALAYLVELMSRIRVAIEKKELGINQLMTIIDAARAEIARLEAEIARLEQEKTDLWLDEFRDRLAELVAELEPLYKQFNEVESQIAPNEARIAGFQKEIQLLRESNTQDRNRISNDRLELSKTDALIRDLMNQLMAAEQRKAYLEASIAENEARIAENEQKIRDAQASIKDLEAMIRSLRDKGDALRAKVSTLEIQVERVRNELSIAEVKAARIDDEIAELQDRVAEQEKLLVDNDLAALQNQVANLKNVLPYVQGEVDRQYFYCYGDGALEIVETGGTVVYIIRGEAFQALLENTYGISFDDLVCCDPDGNKDNFGANVPAEVELISIDTFGDDNNDGDGDSFGVDGDGSGDGDGTAVVTTFTCLAQEGVAGRGVIVHVDGNRITVRRYANAGPPLDDVVEIGTCTIVMATVKVPRTGMSMAFTGSVVNKIYQADMIMVW